MSWQYVAQEGDTLAVQAITLLRERGKCAQILGKDECAAPGSVALFTAENPESFRRKRGVMVVSTYKFEHRGITSPAWASNTPFQVALRPDMAQKRPNGLPDAMLELSGMYARWNPWTNPLAPWRPVWHEGSPPATFPGWQTRAREVVAPPPLSLRIAPYLSPIFPNAALPEKPTLTVIGCAAFNAPHTDVVDVLVPQKMASVRAHLQALVESGDFSKVEVVVPDGSMLASDIVQMHLHPYIFMSVSEVEQQLGKPVPADARLLGRNHKRTLQEIAEAFDISAKAMRTQLSEPLASVLAIPVEEVSWMGMLAPYLAQALSHTDGHAALLEEIYLERVKTRPSYKAMHGIDPKAGLRRTFGNAVLYVAEAMYLRDHPECVVANFEANDVYWKGLAPILKPLWGNRVPYIGMATTSVRQPWGY